MRHLVLAGVGHAQLDLLASLVGGVPTGWQVTVVTSQPAFHYSGMLPAIIAGEVPPTAADIPVAAIARAAGLTVREARVVALDTARHTLTLANGDELPYDRLSLDVGSVPAALDVPGAATHAHAMRPFASALALLARVDAACTAAPSRAAVPVVVVGAGAAGVEIAFAIRARILAAQRTPEVTIVDPSLHDGLPLRGFTQAARTLAARALAARGIRLVAGSVREVRADALVLHDGHAEQVMVSAATAWVTGPAAPAWLADAGVECDARGYPLVDDTLAMAADRRVFGGGDCVTLRHAPNTPKAGVYAVRMAPILAANVRAVMTGLGSLQRYTPQADFLALLSTGDGRALLRWRGLNLESGWAQHLKRWIDVRYLRRYRSLAG